jgi:hypothetical protein
MLNAATISAKGPFDHATGLRMGTELVRKLGQTPTALWLFCAPLPDMTALITGICDGAGCDRLIGCTTAGEITGEGLGVDSAVLAGLFSDHIEVEIISVEGLGADSTAAGMRLAESFSATPKYLQIFSDGLTGNGSAILRGIAAKLGDDVPICGGAAGDNGRFKRTHQFAGGKLFTDALCGVAFYGDVHFGTGVRSGWEPIGLAKRVTRARDNIVYELNGEPALDVFERFLGHHSDKLPAIGVEYPLGFSMLNPCTDKTESLILRATMAVDRRARGVVFAGDIPEGAMVYLTCGDINSILDAAETAAIDARRALNHSAPQIVFCFSCMARRIVLGRRTEDGIKRIRSQFGPSVPLIGFYSYGEYSPFKLGTPSFLHNETMALTAMGDGP